MKLTNRLIKHINPCISQFIQQVFLIFMPPKQDTPMLRENDNTLENFVPYKDKESTIENQEIEKDHRDLVGKSFDIRSCTKDCLSGHIPQARLFASELLSFLKEVKIGKQEFPADKFILEIKYHHPGFPNNNSFYPFND